MSQPTEIAICELFDVLHTKYGRACFASRDVPHGTNILTTNTAFGSTILHEFRKEVCATCFHYEYGTYCKLKVPTPQGYNGKKFQGAGLWFCSQKCVDEWTQFDVEEKLTLALETMLVNYQMKVKQNKQITNDEENDMVINNEAIEQAWTTITEWDDKISKMKKSKQANQIPFLNEEEYVAARFVILVLFHIHTNHSSTPLFEYLQSNELEKISRFPLLLKSQARIYKFLRLSLPEFLQNLLTVESLRLTFGREYGNAFGIRQITDESSTEEKEFLGYMVSPEASFFNHSCRPNLKKSRCENRMVFTTMRDVKQGEQLCIDYFQISQEQFAYRQKTLSENWFFQCACDRCSEERVSEDMKLKMGIVKEGLFKSTL